MWLDRNQSSMFIKNLINILRQGKPVLEMLKQLHNNRKIVKITMTKCIYMNNPGHFVCDPIV